MTAKYLKLWVFEMIKNDNLRSAGDEIEYTKEQLVEYAKCRQDIFYFAEKYYKTRNANTGSIDNIKLYQYQKKILKIFINPPKGKRNVIIMQPRQSGKTTVVGLYILHFLLFNVDKNAMILAQVEKTALEIMHKIKHAYELLPKWLQQGVTLDGWNSKSIKLENGCRAFCSTTSGVSSAGFTIDLLYLDEFALIPNSIASSFYASVYPTVAAVPDSKIIITSTPRGMNKFHDIWKKAVDGENNYYAFRVKWDEPPGRNQEWLDEQIATLGNRETQQEFLCNFLGSSLLLVDSSRLEKIKSAEPVTTWYGGLMDIFEMPIKGERYVVGVDSASGTGKDFSVIQVLRYTSDREVYQVASYRNDNIIPDDFAKIVISVSNFYNFCPIMAESNNGCGDRLCTTIFYEYDCDRLCNCDRKGLGVLATRKSKFDACMNLKRYFDNGWVNIRDQRTIYELSRFEENEGSMQTFSAASNEHDDSVTALYWALYYFMTTFFEGVSKASTTIENEFKVNIEIEDRGRDDDRPVFASSTYSAPRSYTDGSGMYRSNNDINNDMSFWKNFHNDF